MNPPCGLFRRELTGNNLVGDDQRCIAILGDGSICGHLFTQHPHEGILLYTHCSLCSTPPESCSTMNWHNYCPACVCVCRCLTVLFLLLFFVFFSMHAIACSFPFPRRCSTYHPFSNTFRTLLFVPVAAARRIPFRNSCSIIFNRLDLFLSLSFMSGCNGLTGYVDLLFVPNVPVCVMFWFVFVLNLMK